MSIEASNVVTTMKHALEDNGLYEITGRIEDIDKCIVHRSVIRQAIATEESSATQEPKREWVGLTDEEIAEWTPEIHDVIRAIEAELKEKNT